MKQTLNKRVSYTPEQRAALVREFRSSGETQEAFARRHGVKWTTFRNWLHGRRAAAAQTPPRNGFQEIRIVPPVSGSPWAAEINLEGGTVVRLQAGVDPQWAQAIIQPLRRSC